MGCLPVLVFPLLGIGIGYVAAGPPGALWGTGIGLIVGLIAGAGLIAMMRRGNRD